MRPYITDMNVFNPCDVYYNSLPLDGRGLHSFTVQNHLS
jgi:hypothetical protein